MPLRQHVEKQLNKVELSNKFSKAVFFEKGQEFTVPTREEQEVAANCKTLIQNAIVQCMGSTSPLLPILAFLIERLP